MVMPKKWIFLMSFKAFKTPERWLSIKAQLLGIPPAKQE
jgi:hypothetical protein